MGHGQHQAGRKSDGSSPGIGRVRASAPLSSGMYVHTYFVGTRRASCELIHNINSISLIRPLRAIYPSYIAMVGSSNASIPMTKPKGRELAAVSNAV